MTAFHTRRFYTSVNVLLSQDVAIEHTLADKATKVQPVHSVSSS